MSTTKTIEKLARKLCRHTVVFTAELDILCAVRAMQGRSTLAIAEELGLTLSQVTYRILKAQKSMKTKFRADYRNGVSEMSRRMLKATQNFGVQTVRQEIAPKFIPYARAGVARVPRG